MNFKFRKIRSRINKECKENAGRILRKSKKIEHVFNVTIPEKTYIDFCAYLELYNLHFPEKKLKRKLAVKRALELLFISFENEIKGE